MPSRSLDPTTGETPAAPSRTPVPTLEEARQAAAKAEGWLQPQEGPLLFELASKCTGRGGIVEIGSWKGKSSIWLAMGARASGTSARITAIDPHTGSDEHQSPDGQVWTFDAFRQNIEAAGVADRIDPIVDFSTEAAKTYAGPVELLWVDGAHDYDSVVADIESWEPKLVEGGVIAFHDSNWPGVRKALAEKIYRGAIWADIRRVEGITWARKVRRASPRQRAQNLARLWARRVYDEAYARRERLPTPIRNLGKSALRRLDRDAER